jgi:hypothetical protein
LACGFLGADPNANGAQSSDALVQRTGSDFPASF